MRYNNSLNLINYRTEVNHNLQSTIRQFVTINNIVNMSPYINQCINYYVILANPEFYDITFCQNEKFKKDIPQHFFLQTYIMLVDYFPTGSNMCNFNRNRAYPTKNR